MLKKDPRVDAYIDEAADFARPILSHIRRLVHAACPDVQETLKWNCPHVDISLATTAPLAVSSMREHFPKPLKQRTARQGIVV